MIQSADNSSHERRVMTIGDVQVFLGRSRAAANRLISQLEAAGLKRKGRGNGTHYDRRQFVELWEKMDTRP